MLRLVVFFSAVLAVQGQTTQVNRCTWFGGELPINAYIEGCIIPPCQLPQLQDAVINMVFKIPRSMTTMRTLANAFVPPILLPIPYGLGDAAHTCNFLTNSFCPVVEGEIVRYQLRMPILIIFPLKTSAEIEFRINDDNNRTFICIRVPILIVAPVGTRNAGNATIPAQ